MKVGIISDSHDHHANILKAVDIFNEHEVGYILHAGDIISPFAARAFSEVKGAKFIAVFGNNDGEKRMLAETIIKFAGAICEPPYIGRIEGKRVFMTHSPQMLEQAAGGEYDLVVYGHTHKQDIRLAGGTLVGNPGEATDWITGKSGVLILELDDMSYKEVIIDCRQRWSR